MGSYHILLYLEDFALCFVMSGGRGRSSTEMSHLMYETIREYIRGKNYKGYLKYIQIVVYDEQNAKLFLHSIRREVQTYMHRQRKISGTYLEPHGICQIIFKSVVEIC